MLNKSQSPKMSKQPTNNADDDDGETCPVCLDSWEMSGQHRLVSLKCGHLFGNSCIRRYLNFTPPKTNKMIIRTLHSNFQMD